MKKINKILAVSLATFFGAIVPTFASEMTFKDFTDLVEAQNPNADYIYVIGKYAFTSKIELNTQDVMLAARSIDTADKEGAVRDTDVYKAMAIHQIEADIADDGSISGWTVLDKNLVGETKLEATQPIEIDYIDYEKVKDREKVNTDTLVKDGMKVNTGLFTIGEPSEGEITVNVENLKTIVASGMNSDVLQSLLDIVKDEKVDHIDFEYNSDVKFTFTKETTIGEATTWFTQNCKNIFNKDIGDVITADLIGKSFTANLYLAETEDTRYLSEEGNINAIYTITFTGEKESINIDELMNNAMKSVNTNLYKPQAVDDGKLVVDIVNLKGKIEEGMHSNILATLIDLVQNGNVESVDFSYQDLTFTYDKNTTVGGITTWLIQNCPTIFDKPYTELINADLLDKSFTAKVNLKSYAEAQEGQTGEYVVSFTGTLTKVETDQLVSNAMQGLNADIYKAVVSDDKVNVTIQDVDQSIFAGMGSKILVQLSELLKNEDVKEVIFTYDGSENPLEFTYTKKTTNGEAVTWLTQNCNAIFGVQINDLKNSNLLGKTFKAQVVLEPWAKVKDNNHTEFTVSFEAVKHTITFNTNGAKEVSVSSIQVADGQKLTVDQLPVLHKDDNVLTGWTIESSSRISALSDNELNIETYVVKEDITLTAQWEIGLSEEALEDLSKTAMEKIKAYNVGYDPEDDHKIIATFDESVADQVIMTYLVNQSHFGTGSGTGLNDAMTTFAANNHIEKVTIQSVNGDNIEITVAEMKTLASNLVGTQELAEKILKALGFEPTAENIPLYTTVKHGDFAGKSVKFTISLKEGEKFPEGFNPEYTLTFQQATAE